MELVIGIISISGLLFLLLWAANKEAKVQSKVKERQEDINKANETLQNSYVPILKKMVRNYDLKACPKCGELQMKLLSVSPTCQSIEYECEYCHKKVICKLLPGKDGSESMSLYNKANQILKEVEEILEKYDLQADVAVHFNLVHDLNNESGKDNKRPYIPESVRREVWRRDQGKCVECGSKENLEFDHIIPVSKGGSNTARNIQLLCEKCNRQKSNNI